MSLEKNTIGVLRLSALGDAVLVVPMIHDLINAKVFDEVTWITTSQVHELIGPIKGCRYIIIEKINSLGSALKNWQKLRAESFDKLIVAQASFSAHAISLMISARSRIGFDQRRGKDLHGLFVNQKIEYRDEHFIEAYLSMAKLAGVSSGTNKPDYSLAFKHLDKDWAQSYRVERRPLVALHPHPSREERRWICSRYRSLVSSLVQRGCRVLILGGTGVIEYKLNQEILEGSSEDALNLTGSLSLMQWASLLSEVDLLVAPDTGAIHLANALGTPVVGLFAVANPYLTGPYHKLEHSINKYPDAIRKFGGGNATDFHDRVHDSRAMRLIKFNEVWDKVTELLDLLKVDER